MSELSREIERAVYFDVAWPQKRIWRLAVPFIMAAHDTPAKSSESTQSRPEIESADPIPTSESIVGRSAEDTPHALE